MQIGLDSFSQLSFSQPATIAFEYWNELSKNDIVWTKMNPRIVGYREPLNEGTSTVQEINNAG